MQQKSLVSKMLALVLMGFVTTGLSVFYFSKAKQSSRESGAGVIEVSALDDLSDATKIPHGSYISFKGELDPDRFIQIEEKVGSEATGYFLGLQGIDDTLIHCMSSSTTSENVVEPCFSKRRAGPKPEELAEFARIRNYHGQIFGQDESWRAGPSYLMSDAAEEFGLQEGFRIVILDVTPADAAHATLFGTLAGYLFGSVTVVMVGTMFAVLIQAMIVRNRAVRNVGAQEEQE